MLDEINNENETKVCDFTELETVNFLESYNKANNSFKKKCVFAVGHSQGFFSEINNMIFAMLYCIKNEVKFMPYTKTANFADTKGWEEFFEPFCEEFNETINKKINYRTTDEVNSLFKRKPLKFLKFKIKSNYFMRKHKLSYLTCDIWAKFYESDFLHHNIEIEEFGINGDFLAASKMFAKMIWRFNKQTRIDIENIINSLDLPEKYIAMHIRAGDKIIEAKKINTKLIPVELFMEKLKEKSSSKDIFVFADDYRQVVQLRENYTEYKFYTFCEDGEEGYDNQKFQSLNWNKKKPKLLKLFANVEACLNSDFFVGSWQANPDLFIKMIIDNSKIDMLSAPNE